jgi:hypothetical protein
VSASATRLLQERLDLSDEELLTVLDVDALTVLAGDELPHRPELPLLLALIEPHDPALLRRWLRTRTPRGRPLDLLLARDFAAFEQALGDLDERGFVIGG